VLVSHDPPPYSTLILGVFPFDQIEHVGVNPSMCLLAIQNYATVKLYSKYSKLCDHGTWTLQTNGQTDDVLWHKCTLHGIVW